MNNYKSFEQLKAIALKSGINNNKSAIGIWIKKQGYKKKQVRNGLERTLVYYM